MIGAWSPVSYRYWRFRFQDAANPDTYIEVGRLWLGTYLEPTLDHEPGYTESLRDLSVIQESLNGVTTGVERPKLRRFSLSFPIVETSERDNWLEFRDDVGTHREWFLALDVDNEPEDMTIYCRCLAPPSIDNVYRENETLILDVEEVA